MDKVTKALLDLYKEVVGELNSAESELQKAHDRYKEINKRFVRIAQALDEAEIKFL